jgi:hypothetical protein
MPLPLMDVDAEPPLMELMPGIELIPAMAPMWLAEDGVLCRTIVVVAAVFEEIAMSEATMAARASTAVRPTPNIIHSCHVRSRLAGPCPLAIASCSAEGALVGVSVEVVMGFSIRSVTVQAATVTIPRM